MNPSTKRLHLAVSIGTCALLLGALPGIAAAQPKLGVGLFAPEIPFSGPGERYAFIRGIAQHLTATMGQPVEGHAYKVVKDFDRDVRAGKIQLAIVSAVHTALKRRGTILAMGRFRSPRDANWSIVAQKKVALFDLKGKTLHLPNMGPNTIGFIQNGILAGAVDVKKFFKVVQSPDVVSSLTALQLGHADAAVAPVSSPHVVPVLPGTLKIPPPAFIAFEGKLKREVIDKAKKSILTYGAAAASLVGWQPANPGVYQALAVQSAKRTYRMVLAPVAQSRFNFYEIVNVQMLKPQLPEMEDLFWVP